MVAAASAIVIVPLASFGCMDAERDIPLAVGAGVPPGGQRGPGDDRGDASRDAAAQSNPQGGVEGGLSNDGSGPPIGGGFEGGMSPEGGGLFEGGASPRIDGGP